MVTKSTASFATASKSPALSPIFPKWPPLQLCKSSEEWNNAKSAQKQQQQRYSVQIKQQPNLVAAKREKKRQNPWLLLVWNWGKRDWKKGGSKRSRWQITYFGGYTTTPCFCPASIIIFSVSAFLYSSIDNNSNPTIISALLVGAIFPSFVSVWGVMHTPYREYLVQVVWLLFGHTLSTGIMVSCSECLSSFNIFGKGIPSHHFFISFLFSTKKKEIN